MIFKISTIKHKKTILYQRLIFSICFVYGLLACAQNPIDSTILKKIDKEVYELMRAGDIPGLSLILVQEDKEMIRNYGYADLEDKQSVSSSTLFELGSCSKAFTALAFLKLVRDKNIDINSNVSQYIPWFAVTYDKRPVTITLKQLLHHTSGIPWNTISKIPESEAANALEITVKQLKGQKLKHYPGTQYEYATLNYDVLALVMENILGQSFEEYMTAMFAELGLKNTSIGVPRDSIELAKGHKIGFFKPRPYSEPIFKGNNASGYVFSDSKDILRWLKIQIGTVKTDLHELVQQTHVRDETVAPHNMAFYAMGWENSLQGKGDISHSGQNPDFTSYITFRPHTKTGVAVLANSNSNYTSLIGDIVFKTIHDETIVDDLDPGDQNDGVFSMMSLAMIAYSLMIIAFLFWVGKDILKRRRKYEALNVMKIKNYGISLLLILPFLYGLYLFPRALAGFDWRSILIWLPSSLKTLIGCLVLALVITYIAYFITLLFPQENAYKRIAPKILLMSMLSGLSNVAVIVIITSSIGSDVPVKYLIYYYALAVSVYLLGRRFVQIKLVLFTRGLVYDLQVKLITKIFSTSYQKFEKINKGRVYTVLNDDVSRIGESTNVIVLLISSTVTAFGAFVYLMSIAFWAAVITFVFIISLLLTYNIFIQKANTYLESARDERNIFMTFINDMIDGYKEISLHWKKKIAFKNDVAESAGRFREKTALADVKLINAYYIGELMLVALLGLIAYGIPEFFPNIKTYVAMSFVIVLLYLIGPINRIVEAVPVILQIRIAWHRIHEFINEIPASLHLEEAQPHAYSNVECFEAKSISFQYSGGEVMKNFGIGPVDLEVKKGEILFIIGGNGSGKTTLAKLLTGLYEPNSGQFKINGKVMESKHLGAHFFTVFNPSHLFEKLYGIDVSNREKEVEKYLDLLNLKDKVHIENNAYSTIRLSGGQRKRLALFQCFIEDMPIYLFDEWAADQDPDYRKFFYRTLLPEMRRLGKIVIAITHDDHYFDVPDKVLKMDAGRLVTYKMNRQITHEKA